MNKLYIIAGERNMNDHAALNGGLFANVGMTSKTALERVKGEDYRRKAGGGKWNIILEDVPLNGWEDFDVHDLLKKRDDVKWFVESNNTEEFLFTTDPGDGSVAKGIVAEAIESLLSKEKTIKPEPVEAPGIEKRFRDAGIKHASKVREQNNAQAIYWFRVKRLEQAHGVGGPYVRVKFHSGSHRGGLIFVWNSKVEDFEVGKYYIAKINISKHNNLECKNKHIKRIEDIKEKERVYKAQEAEQHVAEDERGGTAEYTREASRLFREGKSWWHKQMEEEAKQEECRQRREDEKNRTRDIELKAKAQERLQHEKKIETERKKKFWMTFVSIVIIVSVWWMH